MATELTKLTTLEHLKSGLTAAKNYTDTQDAALGARIDKVANDLEDVVNTGGQPNVIETVKVNGSALPVTDKAVDITITHPEYSIVKATDSGSYAAVYNLTKDGAVVGASINIPKDLVVKSGSVVDGNIVLVLNDEANTEITIAASSLIEYVTSGSAAGDMVVINVSDDHKVTATITDGSITLAKLATEVKDSIAAAESNAKAYADGLAGNYDAKGSAAAAETAAKAYADGLASNYDSKGAAAQALTDAKAYADGLAGNYDAKGSAAAAETAAKTYADGLNTAMDTRVKAVEEDSHTHGNKTVLDGITSAKVTAWDAAEQNAKDYADGLAGNYDAKGSAATAESNAKEYADGLAVNYDAKGAAATAETNAKSYADGLATNYDAAGSAAQALTDAKAYTDSMIASTTEVNTMLDEVFGA